MKKHYLTAILLGCLWMPLGVESAQTCVSGMSPESTPTGGFNFPPPGTGDVVTHTATGLMWKRCLEGQSFAGNMAGNYLDDTCTTTAPSLNLSWQAALDKAQVANTAIFGGFSDWRVPNLKELKSIVEYCRAGTTTPPSINLEIFPGSAYSLVWSSSPVVNDTATPAATTLSWVVNFGGGSDDGMSRSNLYPVRLVRGGL